MKKKYAVLLLLPILCFSTSFMRSMEIKPQQGPMNADWFYGEKHRFWHATRPHQDRDWTNAEYLYLALLEKYPFKDDTNYDKHMARLNLASCLMAQRHATEHWKSFDFLLNIPKSQRISKKIIQEAQHTKEQKLILVRTDLVGIGDIFGFLSAAHELKNRTNWNIILSVPHFLKPTLTCAATEYGFDIISAKDTQPTADYETHLIGLLGHLELTPAQMNPHKVVFTAPERAMNAVAEQISPILINYHIAVVFLGENRQATLIGGKQLPRDMTERGRHLSSAPFENLLKECPVTLIDCSTKNNKLIVDDMYKHRCVSIAQEEQPFDTIIALARIMSTKKRILAFGADTGPTNVFARALDHDAQDRMAFIIPNPKEYDMRMEGEGKKYKQMISNCWVYKCNEPGEQTKVIEKAYLDMMKY